MILRKLGSHWGPRPASQRPHHKTGQTRRRLKANRSPAGAPSEPAVAAGRGRAGQGGAGQGEAGLLPPQLLRVHSSSTLWHHCLREDGAHVRELFPSSIPFQSRPVAMNRPIPRTGPSFRFGEQRVYNLLRNPSLKLLGISIISRACGDGAKGKVTWKRYLVSNISCEESSRLLRRACTLRTKDGVTLFSKSSMGV